MTSNMVTVPTRDGKSLGCYLAKSEEKSAPVIVVIQEIFGITDWLKSFANNLAKLGYNALVPDLFFRLEPGLVLNPNDEKQLQKAFQLYGKFDQDQGVEDLKDVAKYARTISGANGKVGVVGFCLGGKMSYFMATRSDVDCTASYYGGGIDEKLNEADKIKNPIILHLAEADGYIKKDAQQKIKQGLADIPNATVYIYPGVDHAFAREGGQHYDKTAADLANARTIDFFKTHLLGTRVTA